MEFSGEVIRRCDSRMTRNNPKAVTEVKHENWKNLTHIGGASHVLERLIFGNMNNIFNIPFPCNKKRNKWYLNVYPFWLPFIIKLHLNSGVYIDYIVTYIHLLLLAFIKFKLCITECANEKEGRYMNRRSISISISAWSH